MSSITLPRRTLHAFRTALKKHLGLKARDDGPCVRVDAADEGGTRLTSVGPDGRGVSLLLPGDRPPGGLVLPYALLVDAGAAKHGDVQLAESDGGDSVVANWEERGVPRSARGKLAKTDRDRAASFAPPAAEFRVTQPGLGDALRAACEVTDADSGRYALGCVRLDPHAGRVEATDSHCLLIARGFTFGFEQPVLLPAPHVLSAPPLRGAEVRVAVLPGGKSAGLVVLSCGDWTVWAPEARDARFPELDRVVPGGEGRASVSLSEADAAFLRDRLASLPGAVDDRRPVTLEAAGGVLSVRAAEEGGAPVELATSDSPVRGAAACAADRRFLALALAAGCPEIALHGPEEPVRCEAPGGGAGGTTVVFATLAGDPVPAADAVRLTAGGPAPDPAPKPADERSAAAQFPAKRSAGPAPRDPGPSRSAHLVIGPAGRPGGRGPTDEIPRNGRRGPDAPDHDALLERVSALGGTLSEAASEARSLATDLRKLKRRNRTVTSALAGLKRLGSLVV